MAVRRATVLVTALGAGLLLGTHVAGMDVGLLHLLPALVVAAPLAWGRYVGEERLAALAAAIRPARRPRAAASLRARLPRALRVTASRGGHLLAAFLAERGPPAGLVAAR